VKTILNTGVIALSFMLLNAEAQEMSAEDEWRAKAEIRQLVDKYAFSRDNLDADGYAGVFAENGTLLLFGESYTGREAIRSLSENWNTDSVGMHIMSTSLITLLDERSATGINYATVYGETPDSSHQEGDLIPVTNFVVQGRYFDKYELTDEGWKISERRFEPIYSGP